MELIEGLPEVKLDQIFPDCVNLLVEILNSTRNEEIRKQIGEQSGIEKLHSFSLSFFSHPHASESFNNKKDANPPFPAYYHKIATNLLRIFRNLCVNSSTNQNRIRETNICGDVISFLIKAVSSSPSQDALVAIRSGVQFLGNFVTSNQENATYFWKLGFPDFFSQMLSANDHALCEHTLMLLYNCIRQSADLRKQLVSSSFFKTFIGTLASLHDSHDQSFQWVYFTLMSVFSDDLFEQAYETLRSADNIAREQELQLAMLKVLDAMVEKVAEELPRRAGRDIDDLPNLDEQNVITPACCSFFVRELSRMYNKDFSRVSQAAHAANAASAQDNSSAGPRNALPAPPAQPLTTVLSTNEYELIYFMLRVLGHVTSLVEECDSTRMSKNGTDLRTNLGKEGLIALVIGTLRGAWELEQAAKARKEKGALFAPGYKRELMSLIANLTYNNKRNQDEVRELGGVELVLNHCNIDDNNPFIREWALFAVRNLLEDNPENQAIVSGLKAERVADTHGVMQEMGIGAELVNGVLKFKQNVPEHLQGGRKTGAPEKGKEKDGSY